MQLDAKVIRRVLLIATTAFTATGGLDKARAGDDGDADRLRQAIAYLDGRQEAWFEFTSAKRGQEADRTTCISCHTGISYAIARPALGRFNAEAGPPAALERMLAAVRLRVEHWADLDSPRFRLMYDSDDKKKVEARGTEAVINALILARDDSA
ncbi:MAG TPA: hypothetical protein VGY53_09260, partial [Isosphaeraceae bacterium]|nr:hypothetical protein [Isosphaeraceae bacterium]